MNKNPELSATQEELEKSQPESVYLNEIRETVSGEITRAKKSSKDKEDGSKSVGYWITVGGITTYVPLRTAVRIGMVVKEKNAKVYDFVAKGITITPPVSGKGNPAMLVKA